MNITICGHRKAAELLEAAPNQLDIIFISSPDDKFGVAGSEKIKDLAREHCEILFHDIQMLRKGKNAPQMEHVKQAIEFAEDKDNLIVACQAGISRSSAIAYVIQAWKFGSQEAFKILDPKIHQPNMRIIRFGAFLLDDYEVMDDMERWKSAADEISWEEGPSLT